MNAFASAGAGAAPPLEKKDNSSPEDEARDLEKKVNKLLEDSAIARSENKLQLALDQAKEAARKERQLGKLREQKQLMDQMNIDLTYAVYFNLATQLEANEYWPEALNSYSLIVKNKQYTNAGRLRINIGNIYFKQQKFPAAIKMYRMALDQIPNSGEHLRFKIMRNIGNAFVRMGNYKDAIMSYEASMEGKPDFQSGFNLIVCYFALGDKEKMKRSFAKLLDVKDTNFGEENEDDEVIEDEDEDEAVMEEDELKKAHKEYRSKAKQLVLQAAKLIAPKIEKDFVAGFDYIIEMLQKSQNYMDVASDMQISKAIYFLKQKNPEAAKETLKGFERQDNNEIDATTMSRAYTNLCFIYYLEGNIKEADKYGTKAIQSDRYNAKALVNKGNCEMSKAYTYEEKERYDEAREHFTMAKELYMEGIGVEADCIEAIFNLGLCCKSMAHLEHMLQNDLDYQKNIRAALQAFDKLYSIMPDSPECNYNIAIINDEMQKTKKASIAYQRLIALVKTDAGVLARYGSLLARENDEGTAYEQHHESYKFFPVDMEVISWLGAYFVKSEMYEKAMEYFQKAAQIQPKEVKWRLMVASCYRRIGSYQQALRTYEDIEKSHPDNLECLNYLVRLCKELGMREKKEEYQAKLAKAESEQAKLATLRTMQDMGGMHGQQEFNGGGGRRDEGYVGYGEFHARAPEPDSLTQQGQIDAAAEVARAVAERKAAGGAKKVINKAKEEEDDWGDEELGEDLLPM